MSVPAVTDTAPVNAVLALLTLVLPAPLFSKVPEPDSACVRFTLLALCTANLAPGAMTKVVGERPSCPVMSNVPSLIEVGPL